MQAVQATLLAQRQGVEARNLPGQPSPALVDAATRSDLYEQWTRDYLT
jgi:hypothetical protein